MTTRKLFWFAKAIFVVFSIFYLSSTAFAGFNDKAQSLSHSDPAENDSFGTSVSIDGDRAVIGCIYNDDNGDSSGSAYIFMWDGNSWALQEKLLPNDVSVQDYFGISVSISGDNILVGALFGDGINSDTGSAYIYEWNGVSWVQQPKLVANDGAASDFFGSSVCISGDYAFVGASLHDGIGANSGAVYFFRRDGSNWTQQDKLVPSGNAADDEFGKSIAISGDYAIIGATGVNDNGQNAGAAYIYHWNGNNWEQQQKLLANDGSAGDQFGLSVSISGDYAIIGAANDDDIGINSGAAYIFKRDGVNWIQHEKLLANDGSDQIYFGHTVSISGDYAIVGIGNDSHKKSYIYQFNGVTWIYQETLAPHNAFGAGFGKSSYISSNHVVVSATNSSEFAPNAGAAYFFTKDTSTACVWQTTETGNIYYNEGKVGIGTNEPMSELAVNGTITAKEIHVTLDNWADFVLDENYKLPSLESVESYIKENNHLPGISSEKDIKKNGLSMGHMMARQMEKIEELTLYLIDIKKELTKIKKENEELHTRIKKLEFE